jgi:hypothetical protein
MSFDVADEIRMQLFRRFLVVQALMLWQGGFLFYAAIVVPTGTDVLGSFEQGRVTRHVTDTMNAIGAIAVAILAWDQLNSLAWRRTRWGLWTIFAIGVAMLFWLHPRIENYIDFSANGRIDDYQAFYFWHRVYLYVASAQWLAGLAYVAVTLRAWSAKPRAA